MELTNRTTKQDQGLMKDLILGKRRKKIKEESAESLVAEPTRKIIFK